ncbi:hypothetical protein OJAV_G00085160 [Oryzias javanicus]|uniref:Protein-serine/threonine phosphatase n=1 Tax=Oryzias javanicus TaxID=123683 RepID=A0A3S2Q245_ORYJA|nr:hypothetical protein OJAV_G00085160 [Oryzias javanicus]
MFSRLRSSSHLQLSSEAIQALVFLQVHGKRILKLLQKIFSWLPLATVIDQKVLVLHGGISDTTDLAVLAKVDRHNYVSALRPPKKRNQSLSGISIDMDIEDEGWGTSRVFQRRASLTYAKSMGTRSCFHNRSLQDFSGRIKMNMENELEISRRKQDPDVPVRRLSFDLLRSRVGTSSVITRGLNLFTVSKPLLENGVSGAPQQRSASRHTMRKICGR